MALPDTGIFTRWLYERLGQWSFGNHGARPPADEVRHKGFVVTVCILASVLLWFTFAMRETYTRTIDFPIEVQNLSTDQALFQEPPSMMRAQVEGEGIQLLRLYYNPPVIPVDASTALVDLEIVAPEVVQGVRLEAITPRSVTLYREPRETKRVPVQVDVGVRTQAGHHVVGQIVAVPDSVDISGAASIIRRTFRWPTVKGSVEPSADTLDASVALSDTLAGLITLDVDRVQVRAAVREFTEGSRVVEVRVIGAPPGQLVSLEPSTVQVTYQVPLADYQAAAETTDLYAFVPYDAILTDTTGSVKPELRPPPGIVFRGISFSPPTLRYFDVKDYR